MKKDERIQTNNVSNYYKEFELTLCENMLSLLELYYRNNWRQNYNRALKIITSILMRTENQC